MMNYIGVGIGSMIAASRRYVIRRLFASGEQGLWFDLSDLSTLFQDTAGTTPVTAPGQTVALARDKSGRGNHLVQPVALSRPTLGRHPVGGRRNLLTYTEDLSNAVWSTVGADQGGGTVAKTAAGVAFTTPSPDRRFALAQSQITQTVSGDQFVISALVVPSAGSEVIAVGARAETRLGWVAYDTVTRQQVAGYTASTPFTDLVFLGADEVSPGMWRISALLTANAHLPTPFVHFGSAGQSGSALRFSSGVGELGVVNMQVERGSVDTPYQRVTSDWDVTEAGKADCWYLGFDGIDDFMVTAATLDLSATDKVTLFAGVEKFTDASVGTVAEFSANVNSNLGTFYLLSGNTAPRRWSALGRGSAATTDLSQVAYDTTAAPDAAVLTTTHDIAADLSTIRRNGVAGVDGAGDKGTGNFGNYLLYVGRRGGTSLPFSGRIYQLVIRGADTPEHQVVAVEAQIAAKMGITL